MNDSCEEYDLKIKNLGVDPKPASWHWVTYYAQSAGRTKLIFIDELWLYGKIKLISRSAKETFFKCYRKHSDLKAWG